ncbi:uncharacterized protein CEXT_670911 [Caerostris extrusa]|uniref:Uncharacterized protein n=1 Tax=Caerostris extrusa TaxID=172846 RepID=A0AAV4MSS5_CAEEX|nr:uncharacterized protein CEXT_670911 [Caerostris extrusa]
MRSRTRSREKTAVHLSNCFHEEYELQFLSTPSCADVSTDVKDDKENRDAVTQTTPLPLSRSSSFTWVTECDCSDWDVQNENSNSDESLIMSGCSNCKAENRNLNSSSSSLDISSDGDEDGPASPASGNSSLYLSACSGSSDSFEEATLAPANDGLTTDYMKLFDDVFASGDQQIRNSEATLRGSILGDISEEQVISETISMKSNISNPSLTDSNNADPQGQSASFPSTLKVSRKYRSTGSPAQPIEPTVLVINDLNLKSVSAPVLLRQKRVSSSKAPESSSSDSSPPTGTRNKDCLSSSNQVIIYPHNSKCKTASVEKMKNGVDLHLAIIPEYWLLQGPTQPRNLTTTWLSKYELFAFPISPEGMDVELGGYVFACAISVRRIYLKFSP